MILAAQTRLQVRKKRYFYCIALELALYYKKIFWPRCTSVNVVLRKKCYLCHIGKMLYTGCESHSTLFTRNIHSRHAAGNQKSSPILLPCLKVTLCLPPFCNSQVTSHFAWARTARSDTPGYNSGKFSPSKLSLRCGTSFGKLIHMSNRFSMQPITGASATFNGHTNTAPDFATIT